MNFSTANKSRACPQCVEKCQRKHCSQTAPGALGHFTPAPSHPCFLRTALEHNLRSNMSIPKAFLDAHGKNLCGGTVDLEGANGNVWLVTVDAIPGGVTGFRFGWQVFAADNNLMDGDSLLFTLVSKNRFTVRVFNRTGLEIDEPGKPTKTLVSKFTPKAQARGDELISISTGTNEYGQSLDPGEGLGRHGPSIQDILISHGFKAGEPNRRKIKGKSRRPKRERKTHHPSQQGEPLDPEWNSTVWESRRRLVTECERQSALTASEELVTSRPSISVLMKPCHVYRGFWLTIPLEFSRQHLPPISVDITLQDTFGYQWAAKWVVSGHHSGVGGGWAAFSLDHRLEEGDVCVLEVLDSMKECIILVHIFRVVEVPLKPGSRGGWDVAYNVVLKSPPRNLPISVSPTDRRCLPVLNVELSHGFAVKPEPSMDGNLRKRPRLAQALQKMVRNGQFPKQQRKEDVSSKIRASNENGMLNKEVKSDTISLELVGAIHRPINLLIDSVKTEPEDVCTMTPTRSRSSPVIAEAKTESNFVEKLEDMSSVRSVSPVQVYSRRHRKEGSLRTASKSSELVEKELHEKIL
ncbi:hypothetical protein M758_11G083100 [Ceratodon purpureus]|nr:hypothetical protein M758_11G083100 [Ceratodon purpureus]